MATLIWICLLVLATTAGVVRADCSIVAWGGSSYGQLDVPAPNTNFAAVAVGDRHCLGLRSDGTIVGWGDNAIHELDVPSPNSNFVAVAAGYRCSIGLKADGTIVGWGDGSQGQLANLPPPDPSYTGIAYGGLHGMALKSNGSIVTWGNNNDGQNNVPSPNTNFVAIAAGPFNDVGLKADGSVVVWGRCNLGECTVPSPNTNFTDITAGDGFCLALKSDGSVIGWGDNFYHQLDVPVPNTGFTAVAAGIQFSLGLKSDGTIAVWGNCVYGSCTVPTPNSEFTALAAAAWVGGGLRCPPPANTIAAGAPATCISTAHPCVTVPVDISRSDATAIRGVSVDVQLSSSLTLCNGTASITEGTYLNGVGNTMFNKVDHGGGSYTVDCFILGVPCGATAASGNLFNLAVTNSGGDGTGTVTITGVRLRDCSNAVIGSTIGSPASITIDNTPPVAITNLAAAQVTSGNDADGTTKIALTFTAPGDASAIRVYRAPYGVGDGTSAYPEYNDVGGAGVPSVPSNQPASPWTLTNVTASGGQDEVATRGYWYYAVVTEDACGNISPVSNIPAGRLNYHLGDTHNGIANCSGDNQVTGSDVSHLGNNYGVTLGTTDARACLDVGPTADNGVNTMPTTDNHINFEDAMIFGMNFGAVTLNGPSGPEISTRTGESVVAAAMVDEGRTSSPWLALTIDPMTSGGQPGALQTAHLRLEGNTSETKGIHARLSFDPSRVQIVDVDRGALLADGNVFFKRLDEEKGFWADAAVLGTGETLHGSGEVAVIRYRSIGANGRPALTSGELRDAENRSLVGRTPKPQSVIATSAAPSTLNDGALRVRPNPVRESCEISFRLPAEDHATLRIFDAGGRLVRTVVDAPMSPGDHTVVWDGRTEQGVAAGGGIYFCQLHVGGRNTTQKLLVIQ